MIEPDSTQYIIQAFGLTPDGLALARVRNSGELSESNSEDTVQSASIADLVRNSEGALQPTSDDTAPPASMAGRVVLCEGLMPGETAEVLLDDTGSRMLTARLVRIIERSPDRAEPFCPVYNECGGCTCQTLTYEALLLEKQRHIRDCLLRIARIPEE
ncbi:MAG: hypothetical protein JW817_07135, partial [Clostridiales bacterium]|nr:hypothetical protein [Clostridiales bacterium]